MVQRRFKHYLFLISTLIIGGTLFALSLASGAQADSLSLADHLGERSPIGGEPAGLPLLSSTLMITTSPDISQAAAKYHQPSQYQSRVVRLASQVAPEVTCNPTGGSGGLGAGTHDTTIAGQPATVIVGAGYTPAKPTYLALYLHGDEGGYNFHTSSFNEINQFINNNNWVYVAPQVYKATDGDYYPWDGRGGGSIENKGFVRDTCKKV